MSNTTYTLKTAVVPVIEFPQGASLELSIPMDAAYDMDGKRVEFEIRSRNLSDRRSFTASTDGSYVTVSDQTTTISIPPVAVSAADSSISLSDIAQKEECEYRVDFLASSGQPVELRLQGDMNFLEEAGDWND